MTQKDFFTLPPSGALYSYPSMFDSSVAARYVQIQTEMSTRMDVMSSVTWELLSWIDALLTYFPRWQGVVGGTKLFFCNNVPYPVPIIEFGLSQIKWIGETLLIKTLFNW